MTFSVRPQDVTAHATQVDAIADGVTTAADAGATVQAAADAYGQLCVMVPTMLNELQSTLVTALHTTATTLHDTAGDLRDTAADYETLDSAVARSLRDTR